MQGRSVEGDDWDAYDTVFSNADASQHLPRATGLGKEVKGQSKQAVPKKHFNHQKGRSRELP